MQVVRFAPRICARSLTRGNTKRQFPALPSRFADTTIRTISAKRYFQTSSRLLAQKKSTEAELPATVVRVGESSLRLTDSLVQVRFHSKIVPQTVSIQIVENNFQKNFFLASKARRRRVPPGFQDLQPFLFTRNIVQSYNLHGLSL
jgi:hypothetical protein